MSKRELQRILETARGSRMAPLVKERLRDMDEEEARQWLLLIRNIIEDAEREGEQKARRRPDWRRAY